VVNGHRLEWEIMKLKDFKAENNCCKLSIHLENHFDERKFQKHLVFGEEKMLRFCLFQECRK